MVEFVEIEARIARPGQAEAEPKKVHINPAHVAFIEPVDTRAKLWMADGTTLMTELPVFTALQKLRR